MNARTAEMQQRPAIVAFRGEHWFLSNFSPSSIHWMGWDCETVEHAFQLNKTLDTREQKAIAGAPTPDEAKRLGRLVTLRVDWDAVKDEVMSRLLLLKFSTHDNLRDQLLRTGERELVEVNTWGDTYWGVCAGVGQNRLGISLMATRAAFGNPPGSRQA